VSRFAFLQGEWAAVFESAARAETAVHAVPRTACFDARPLARQAFLDELEVSLATLKQFALPPAVFVAVAG
jgi:hypothetical protein